MNTARRPVKHMQQSMQQSVQATRVPTTYGVYILDRDEWVQISEHHQLRAAGERALEANELLGFRSQIRFNEERVVMELAAYCDEG